MPSSSDGARRARVGVVLTAPNTVLEPDLWRAGGPGVSWHSSRIPDRAYDGAVPGSHASSVAALAGGVEAAIEAVAPVGPQVVVVGLSAAPFKAGVAAHAEWRGALEQAAGVPVVTLGDGLIAALERLQLRTVALLTPLHPTAHPPIEAFLAELGVEVAAGAGLACPDTPSIAEVREAELWQAIRAIDGPGIDGIVQVGTNLDFVSIAEEASRSLGKPVIAANAAIAAAALARL